MRYGDAVVWWILGILGAFAFAVYYIIFESWRHCPSCGLKFPGEIFVRTDHCPSCGWRER